MALLSTEGRPDDLQGSCQAITLLFYNKFDKNASLYLHIYYLREVWSTAVIWTNLLQQEGSICTSRQRTLILAVNKEVL